MLLGCALCMIQLKRKSRLYILTNVYARCSIGSKEASKLQRLSSSARLICRDIAGSLDAVTQLMLRSWDLRII